MTAPAPPAVSGSTPGPLSSGALMPLVSLRAHKWLALTVMLAVAAGGAVIGWFKGTPVYQATAVVYVAPRFANILRESKELELQSNTQYREFIEQQARTINRYDIMLAALARLGERRRLWQADGESDRHAAERLQRALTIRPVRNAYLITVSLESRQPKGLDAIVNAVVNAYLEQVRKEDIYASDVRIASLRERRDSLVADMQHKVRRRTELAQEVGVTTFADNTLNPYDQLLLDTTNALADAQRRRISAEAQLAAFDGARSKAAQAALDSAASEVVAKDPGLNSLKANLFERRSKLLEQISGLKPGHIERLKNERELRELDEELERATTVLMARARDTLLQLRRAEVRQTQQVEKDLQRQVDAQRNRASWFATRYNEALTLSDEINRARQQLDDIDDRIDFLALESQAPGFVRLESAALPPEAPVSGGRKKLTILFALAGVALGLAAPIVVDLLDRRIKTAAQVEKLLGFRPLAAILERTAEPAVRLAAADQLRRLALALERERTQNGIRAIVLTSVTSGAGVTTLALNLAGELTQSGVRTLVVETNPLQPDERYLSTTPGLVEVLSGEADLAAAIVPADGPLPERMSVGLTVDRHLSLYGRLSQVLEQLRARYDLILLDAPPVLLSADAEFLAGSADATLLVVAAGQDMPGELQRAARILERVNPPVIAAIVNRLPVYQGSGSSARMVQAYQQGEEPAHAFLRSRTWKRGTA